MYFINAKGSYYDIGLFNGKQLIPQKEHGFPPKFSQENLEKSKTYEREVNDYCPGLLDEFLGMAEGARVDYQSIIALECTPFRLQPQCLVFGISGSYTRSGKPLLIRNHEWDEREGKNLTICSVHPKGKLASYGFTFHWPLVSRYGGINEAGLALSLASTSFHNFGPGVIMNIAMRWILDNFKTTEEAVEFIKKIPKVWGTSYIIIDKNETLAKIQALRPKTIVTYPEKGFDMVSMVFEDPELRELTPDTESDLVKIFERRKKFLDTWIPENKGKITEDLVIEQLRNCETSLHQHVKNKDGSQGVSWTAWSWILSPQSNTVLISIGAPCKNEYQPYKIEFT
ncbi:MAG: C45 family autoproteolytic acyltransferase/hydrolase [Candidatus Thorarchaeota archaeon]